MTRRDRLVIVAVAIVAAIAASWFFLISPKRDQASKLGAKVSAAQQQLDTARSELAQNAAASKQYATNYAALARLGQAVPATDQVPSLIFELQSAADGARVDFQGLQNGSNSTGGASTAPTPATPGATAGTAAPDTFSFTFSGSYFQLANFFDRLQRFVVSNGNGVVVHGRLITLNTVNLTPASGGFPQINAMITATTYTEPAPQVSSAGAASSPATAPGGAQAASTTSPSTTPAPTAAISSPIR